MFCCVGELADFGRAEGADADCMSDGSDELCGVCEGNGISVMLGPVGRLRASRRCPLHRLHQHNRLLCAVWSRLWDGSCLRTSIRLQELGCDWPHTAKDNPHSSNCLYSHQFALDQPAENIARPRPGFSNHKSCQHVLFVFAS